MPKDIEQVIKNMAAAFKENPAWSEHEMISRLSWLVGFSIGKYLQDHD